MPVHNGMPFLPETVDSILGQSFPDFELLAIDDGSTDGSTSYLESLGDDRVRYRRLERAGLVAALNEGLRLARSGAIARIDADDIASPTRLEEQYRFLEASPRCTLLGCDFWEIGPGGDVIAENPYRMTSDLALRFHLCFNSTFSHPGVMFRRSHVLETGGYLPQFDVAEDYELFTRLSLRGEVACIPKKLLSKRIHGSAVSVVHRERGLAQSSVIAKAYVTAMFPGLDSRSIDDLYLLYQGRPPRNSTPLELCLAFERLCRRFSAHYGPLAGEILQSIGEVRHNLGWQCLKNARSRPAKIKETFAWFVAARRFDPDERSLHATIRRRVGRMATRLGATAWRLTSGGSQR